MTYRSALTGRTYTITHQVLPYINPDTLCNEPYWRKVEGLVDGKGVMLDSPVWYASTLSASIQMDQAIERFLEGKSHITHYKDFPEIAKALEVQHA